MKKINNQLGFSIAAYHAKQRARSTEQPKSAPTEVLIQTNLHDRCRHLPAKFHKPISLIIPNT